MSDRALSPSALVTFLLDLAKRGFDGSFELGGRVVVLMGGHVVDVGAADGDESVAQFLVDSGRIGADRALALEVSAEGDPSALVRLLTESIGRPEVVHAAQRATWLDRLIRALKSSEERGEVSPRVTAGVPLGYSIGLRVEFASLLLDALARRAGEADAGVVGERAGEHFTLTPRAVPDLSSRWAGFALPSAPTPIFKLLAQSPAAAARIAALVRAGWGRIGSPDELKRVSRHEAEDEARDRAEGDGGARRVTADLPSPAFDLDDPIEPHERALRDLTEAGASPPELAQVYRRIGRIWETELSAIEEAARAYREAAAIDPADLAALTNAARLCRALGRHDLSRAYAEAALAIAEGPDTDEALQSAFLARLRTGDEVGAIDALSSLAHLRGDDPDAFERLARHQARAGDVEGALESGLQAIRIFRDRRPERARHLAEWLVSLAPHRDDLLLLHADMLSLEGFGRAATASLTIAALETTSADERRARLSAAAERAERERRSDLATDLLARAFDDEPGLDILYEPLTAVSSASGAPEAHAVLLESIAIASLDDRAARFLDAARAFERLPRGEEHALELATRALTEAPGNDAARALVARLSPDDDALRLAHARASAGAGAGPSPRDELRRRTARGDEDSITAGLALSGLAALDGDLAASCDAALDVLEIDGNQPLALARAERAARRLRDTARMERAFDAALRASPGTRERSRLLVHLAVLASSRGDEVTSVNRALEAIRVDPSCAEAYVLLTRRLDHIPSEGLGGVVDRARAALGDSALILRRAIEIAGARGLDKLSLRLREARAHMSDLAGDALRARLSLAAFSPEPATPRAAIRDALEVPDVVEEALDELLAALERLVELDPKSASRLALAAIDRHGEGSFVSIAVRAARESGELPRVVAALERAAAWGRGAGKTGALSEIASCHRNAGSLAAEHRALLRLLSVSPRNTDALGRLIYLYAITGELERLEAALSLAIEATEDPTARAAHLVQLARARLSAGHAAGAVSALERLVQETRRQGALPVEALPFAGDVLALFEVAAFELGGEPAVHSFFDALEAEAMGRHARRGLVVRRAKLLEKMGRYEAALAHYGRALAMEPAQGGVLESVERLADALGDELSVAEAWLLLAAKTDEADARVAYVTSASEKLESAGETLRACEVIRDLYKSTNRLDLLPRLFDLARKSGRERRDEIVELVVSKLEERIDGSWDFGDQLRCLGRMIDAELLRERPESASAAANRASELSKTEEDANQEELASLHARLASHFDAEGRHGEARHHASRALEHQPTHETARAIEARLGPPEGARAPIATAMPPLPTFRRPETAAPMQEPEAPSSPRMDLAQTRELMAALLADPAQPAIWLVLSEADDGGGGVRDVASAVRAAFEHDPAPRERPFESPCPVGLPLLEEREALLDALLRALERSVLPLVPRTLEELGGERTEPVAPTDPRPAARAFHDLLSSTGLEGLALYVVDSLDRAGQVTSDPLAIALSPSVEQSAATLPFRMARFAALSCPGALLVGSRRSPEELELVLEALSMAFGGRAPMAEASAEVVALATRLRRELPADEQDEISTLLAESPLGSAGEIHDLVHRRAAGVALLQTGTLHAAILALFEDEPALVAQPPRGLESLYSACKSSPALTELLTLALDPAFAAMYREHSEGA